MISALFRSKLFKIIVIQVYAPTNNAEEAEVDWFDESRPSRINTKKRDVLFITGDWNAKVGSQEISGVTGKFDLEIQYETGQRQTEFCQENTWFIANTLFQQNKSQLYTWTSLDGQYQNQIDYILCNIR